MSVARAGLGAAVRAGDGRGPWFELPTVEAVALAVSTGEIVVAELHGLAPLVFAAAEGGDTGAPA